MDQESDQEGMRIIGGDEPDDDSGLPHWTEPGTGKVPRLTGDGGADADLAAWSALGDDGPRWSDDVEQVAPLVEADPAPVADITIGSGGVEDDFFGYDDGRAATDQRRTEAAAEPRRSASNPARAAGAPGKGASDLLPRIGTGIVLGAIAALCLFLSDGVTLLLIAAILGVAASEFFVSLRRVGYQPATLLGLVASVSLPLGVWWRGESAIGVVLFLTILFGALWYLLGVGTERPVPNLGVTLLGVVYIGVLGSFAALLLDGPEGTGTLLTAILLAVAYDVGGFFVGSAIGRSPLSDASPNKTVEGLLGGIVATVVVGVVIGLLGVGPFDVQFDVFDAFIVGLGAALVAPIGDLAESLMKRDLGLKDMGSILPGHGGLLDRFDALLFVLPTVYYVLRILA